MCVEFCVRPFCGVALVCFFSVSKSFCRGRERADYFIVFLLSSACLCSVSLLRCAMGWSAICDCGISWLHSLVFLRNGHPFAFDKASHFKYYLNFPSTESREIH